ncbi:hypothetical protein TSUD_16810, partial [Trifolium subterraneum]
AFVVPADIQAFTSEVKTKLTARCHGKTKCFTQAVREICAAYDELEKQKVGGLTDDTGDARAPSFDGAVGDIKDATDDVVLNVEKSKTIMEDVSTNLEHYKQRCGERDDQDDKPSASGRPTDSSSPVLSPVLERKSSVGTELNKHTIRSDLEDKSCLKKEVSDCKDVCDVEDFKQANNVQSVSIDGNKARKLVTGSRRRSEAAADKEISGFNIALSKGENSGETVKRGKKVKNAFFVDSADSSKSGPDINSGNKDKNLLKAKTRLKVKSELQEKFVDSKEADRNNSFKKNKTQVQGKRKLGMNETLHATKKFKRMDAKDKEPLQSLPEDMKSASPGFPVVDDKALKKSELKRSLSCLKTEKGLSSRAQTAIADSDNSVCEVLSGTKHHSQVRRRRRPVFLIDDDDDDEESKTPIHGGDSKNIKSPSLVSEPVKSNDPSLENGDVSQLTKGKPSALEDSHLNAHLTKLCDDSLPTEHPQKENADEVVAVNSTHIPEQLDPKLFPSNVEKLCSISPVNSPQSLPTTKSNAKRHKSSKALPEVLSNATQKKAENGSSKSLISSSTLKSQVITHKKKPASSVEKSKTTPKTLPQSVEVHTIESLKELDAFHVDRIELGTEEKSSLYVGSGTPENANTMKHLIAVAQAKRRLVAQFQCHPFDLHNAQVGTPSPSIVQPFLSVSSNNGQADMQGVNEQPSLVSPSTNGYHSISQNQLDAEENEERKLGLGQRAVVGSLSGGTEAAIARDAFEGMIETLSRTKESIGRATRLAIDCAKYGFANEFKSQNHYCHIVVAGAAAIAARLFSGSRSQTLEASRTDELAKVDGFAWSGSGLAQVKAATSDRFGKTTAG